MILDLTHHEDFINLIIDPEGQSEIEDIIFDICDKNSLARPDLEKFLYETDVGITFVCDRFELVQYYGSVTLSTQDPSLKMYLKIMYGEYCDC